MSIHEALEADEVFTTGTLREKNRNVTVFAFCYTLLLTPQMLFVVMLS